MIIQKSKNIVTTSGDFQELTFGVRNEDMGLILEILRSKMYRNPIGSICREIASNSRDANREVGNDTPIKIGFEDSIWLATDLCITFKDEGPGISPDRIADIFVNYGASTKRDSNDQTGGFGLGAKTPFSYSDNFSIVTVVDGIQYIYTAAIDEGRRGKLFLANKEATKARNGTTIIVPVKNEDDREKFEEEVYRATFFWTTQPKYVNFSLEKPKIRKIHSYNKCQVVEQDISDSKYNLLIDGIIYTLDSDQVSFAKHHHYGGGNSVLLEFETGELTISANRESVQYDKRTIKAVEEKFKTFLDHMQSHVANKISSAKSYIEACIQYNSMRDDSLLNFVSNHRDEDKIVIKYGVNGDKQTVKSSFHLRGVQICVVEKDYTPTNRPTKSTFDKDFLELPLYFLDRPSLSAPKNRTIFKDYDRFLSIEFEEKDLLRWDELSFKKKKKHVKLMRKAVKNIEWLKKCGLKWESYSAVANTAAPKNPDGKPKKRDITIYARTVDHFAEFQSDSLVLTGDGKLTTIQGKKELDNKKVACQPIKSLRKSEIIDSGTVGEFKRWAYVLEKFADIRVYFVTENKSAHHFEERGFLTIKKIVKTVNEDVFKIVSDSDFIKRALSDMENYEKLSFRDQSIIESFKAVKDLRKKAKDVDIRRLPNGFTDKYPVSSRIKEVAATIDSIKNRYPLLDTLISEYRYYRQRDKSFCYYINNYIRLVDEDRSRLLPVVITQPQSKPKVVKNIVVRAKRKSGGILGRQGL